MPRYFFHVHDSADIPDDGGTELADRNAAWGEAIRAGGEMLKDLDGRFNPASEWRMEVSDEAGNPVFTLRFSATDHGR